MEATRFTCPHCLYEAELHMFENMANGKLKCRRCRSEVQDPNAFSAQRTYADCDSHRAVTRFPFHLNGKDAMIRVRQGYMALLVGNDGTRRWLKEPNHHITNMPFDFQLYYVYLKPQISWGSQGIEEFGAYGIAHLALSQDYVEAFCEREGNVQTLEEHLRALTVRSITDYTRGMVQKNSQSVLKHSDGYISVLGVLEAGVSLTKIELKGYREANNYPVTLMLHTKHATADTEKPAAARHSAVEKAGLPKKDYRIEDGVEEVFILHDGRMKRHKAGEQITADSLEKVEMRLRFFSKELDFASGWGLYNQVGSYTGYYSAHGTISFYIDSTERLSRLVVKPATWAAFEEEFFSNVLKKELSSALKSVLDIRIAQEGFDPARINEYLSTMSVSISDLLNGETNPPRKPAFMQYGLRVKRIDIDNVNFYTSRR